MLLGPDSEKGDLRRGGSNTADGRRAVVEDEEVAADASGLAVDVLDPAGRSGMIDDCWKRPGTRLSRASSPRLKPRLRTRR